MTKEQHEILDKLETSRKTFNELIVEAAKVHIIGECDISSVNGIQQVDVSYTFAEVTVKVRTDFE